MRNICSLFAAKAGCGFSAVALAGLLLTVAPPLWAETFKVTLLGTGSPIPRLDHFGPGTLVEAGGQRLLFDCGQRLLFDCGRGASQRLWQLRIPLGQVNHVIFTHLHSDHVVGFPDLWLTGWLPAPFGRRTTALRVSGPAGTRQMMTALQQAYEWDLRVRPAEGIPLAGGQLAAANISQGVVYDEGGVKVTAFNVQHGAHLQPALGYRIDYAGHSVVFTGDTNFSENLIQFAAGADVVVHEVIVVPEQLLQKSREARQIVSYHTQPEDAGRVFARVKPRLAVYTHVALLSTDPAISPPQASEIVPRTRTTYAGPLELGEDLLSVEIGEEIIVRHFEPKK